MSHEDHLIGCLLYADTGEDAGCYPSWEFASSHLKATDLETRHRLWSAMSRVVAANRPLDTIEVELELRKSGKWRETDAHDLVALPGLIHTIEHLPSYVASVKGAATARKVARLGMEIAEAKGDDLAATLDRARGVIASLDAIGGRPLGRPLVEILSERADDIEHRQKNKIIDAGITWGLRELDNLIGPIRTQRQYVIAARPGMGKTALAWGACLRAAKEVRPSGGVVIFYSYEMGDRDIAGRTLSLRSGLPASVLDAAATMTDSQLDLVAAAAAAEALPNLFVVTTGNPTANRIAEDVRARRKMGQDVRLVAVDHIGLMPDDGRWNTREQAVASTSKRLKRMTTEDDVATLVLCQLNRAMAQRADKRPTEFDMRESDQIVQDANVIIGVHREGRYDADYDQFAAELIGIKNRDGQVGTAHCRWAPTRTQFHN